MTKQRKILVISFLVLAFLTTQLLATSPAAGYERPEGYFKLVLLVPTNDPERMLHAQVIARELWKIGIDAEVVFAGWDAFIPRLFRSVNFGNSEEDGFDIGFVGWTAGDPTRAGALDQFYHSKRIDKVTGGDNFYPINNSRLDALIDLINLELDFEQRREWVREALDIIVWEEHPVMGLFQRVLCYGLDADLRGFDPMRVGYVESLLPEMYYENSGQTEFKMSTGSFYALNFVLQNYGTNEGYIKHTLAWTYQYDAGLLLQPILATAPPLAIGSNDSLASTIDIATVSADSPYAGATAAATWGPNPALDPIQYNPFVTAANKTMFLVNLRKDIPWQPGWGYQLGDRNLTVEDFQWTSMYKTAVGYGIYGDPYSHIEKINNTLMKINLDAPTPRWYEACQMVPMPRHVLDPTFDATPYGGAVGQTPDGTPIAAYADHDTYAYNTGEKPPIGVGPYTFEGWDASTGTAAYKKFPQWGGYGNNSLWYDPRFEKNNIETAARTVYSHQQAAIIDLENGALDRTLVYPSDVSYLRRQPKVQVLIAETGRTQTMSYNTRHPKLDNRNVRLAISHMVPAQKIVDFIYGGLGNINEVLGFSTMNTHYPTPDEWQTIGLSESENAVDPETDKLLEFQGHIRYSKKKAWALMEKAGYDMDPFRDAVRREEAGEQPERGLEPLPLLLASAGTVALVGAAFVLGRRYWHQYIAAEPEALMQSRQRKRVIKAIRLKQSPRMTEKAQAQELFQQLAADQALAPELTIYSMLNLCDMMLDEVRAYGDQAVLREAEKLSSQLSSIAQEQDSGSVFVESLLLRSKFALLEGKVARADKLVEQAAAVATQKGLPKLAAKVTQEQATLAKEVSRWETLTTQAAPLRDRLEQARLQDYIASAVRIIELEEGLS